MPDAAVRSRTILQEGVVHTPAPRLAVVLMLILVSAVIHVSPAVTSEPEISASGFTSSQVCGNCHTDIYNSWKNSLHAFSLADPIFDAAFMQAVKEKGEEARRLCLRCHAPMVIVNEDFDLSQGITREGVSCDFCHSVTEVHLDGRQAPYSLDVGKVKRSVLKAASSPAHEVAYSQLHETSEFCGGCHNFLAPSGKAIMSTYEEWKNGPYAREGVQCQECHMVLSKGHVVAEEIQESQANIHLHNLIHDTDQLRSALTVQIANANRSGRQLDVEVVVANVGSGHMVPTGMPSREVILTVVVDDGSRVISKERRYRKVVADEGGVVLEQDHQALLYGSRVLNDNRIGPKESRNERFTFELSRDQRRAQVTASLTYSYSPTILRRQEVDVQLGKVERVVY